VHSTHNRFSIYDEVFGRQLQYTPTTRDIAQDIIDQLNNGTIVRNQVESANKDCALDNDPSFYLAVEASNFLHEWFTSRNITEWELGNCMSRSLR
jgi:hypothetical protein